MISYMRTTIIIIITNEKCQDNYVQTESIQTMKLSVETKAWHMKHRSIIIYIKCTKV